MTNPLERSTPSAASFLESREITNLIENRSLTPETAALLERLVAEVPQSIFLENHNTCSLAKERLAGELRRQLQRLSTEEGALASGRRRWCEIFLEIVEQYDWATAWNINSTFEKLPRDVFLTRNP